MYSVHVYIYIHLYVLKFQFVSPNFWTNICQNKMKHDLGETKFQQNFAPFGNRNGNGKILGVCSTYLRSILLQSV